MEYQYVLNYTKIFTSGNLKGISIPVFMKFLDVDSAMSYVDTLGPETGDHQDLCTKSRWNMVDWSIRRLS